MKAGQTRPRPIITKFLRFTDKVDVFQNKRKLEKPLGISEDLPVAIRKARQVLFPLMKQEREKGRRVSIAYPARLIVDGKLIKEVDPMDFNV